MPSVIYCPVCATNDEADVTGAVECNNCETVYALDPQVLAEPAVAQDWPEFSGAILFCPRCCSHLDATGWGARHYTCKECMVGFTAITKPDIVAVYSMYG